MGDQTLFTSGVKVRKGSNTKGTDNTVSDGSVIHVYPNQFMLLVDGGKVIDYTGEPGYFTVKNSSMPSLFNGQLKEAVSESFDRIRFGGQTPTAQKVYFINLQEIKGIKFGTPNPINYFDQFYNAELFLRAHGTYSIKVTDPILFYAEAVPKNADHIEVEDINGQYLSEFLEALQSSINQMSADGIRISYVASKGRELGQYMADVLDDQWRAGRGIEIQSVGIASISYDEESKSLIQMRNQGAMLSDPGIREGYVQGAAARGIEAAGSNTNGSLAGFMGMGMGMNTAGGFMGAASAANANQMQMNQAAKNAGAQETWTCSCGSVNTGKFCPDCGSKKPEGPWTCGCGAVNTGKFCSECGKPRP
jgi:membrane protease subunit (stomatin/prohibitin family)